MPTGELSPAALAFDAIADQFDERFAPWLSVAAQRSAVRAALADAFPPGSQLLEIGGGTGEDAFWLAERGRRVFLTDASPAMARLAAAKLSPFSSCVAQCVAAEDLDHLRIRRNAQAQPPFDGAYSNFATLNCVTDLQPVAVALAHLVRPGASALLVVFGTVCPAEMVVEGVRGRRSNMFRRFVSGDVPARLGDRTFTVRYHRSREIKRAMSPWFELRRRRGIGIFVPPSAAEPWISRHPRLLAVLARFDRLLDTTLAPLGDHVLYHFERSEVAPP